jgi:hypothetical protein
MVTLGLPVVVWLELEEVVEVEWVVLLLVVVLEVE